MNDLTRYRLCAALHLPVTATLLYCYLLDLSGGSYKSVAISAKNLARDLGISRSAARRNLYRLKQMDLIDIAPRYTEEGGRLSNQYILK